MGEALSLAPHEEDAPYLAVAILLNIPIWSSDLCLSIPCWYFYYGFMQTFAKKFIFELISQNKYSLHNLSSADS